MRITKCDICKKIIMKDTGSMQMAHDGAKVFSSFEICHTCSELVIKFLKDKKLLIEIK